METNAEIASAGTRTDVQARATRLFVRMWAVAHVLHLLIADRNALDTPWNIAVVATAIILLLHPGAGRLLATLAVLQLIEYVAEMPLSPDHWALVSFVNIALLLTMLVTRSTALESVTKALPAARLILLVAYGAAAVSKWNTSFLDPLTSCANALADVVSHGLIGPVSESHTLSYGAAITEAMVFLLLTVPRTRCWGVLLGMTFHFTLSSSPTLVVGDFTSTVFALFVLFLSPELASRVLDRTSSWAARSAIARDARRHPLATAAIAFVVLGFGGYLAMAVTMAGMYVFEQLYFIGLLIATALSVREQRAASPLGRIRLVHLPVVAMAVLWALNPYLGLRTTGSFTMFSNLRTESPAPNHLFMPSFRLTDWQDEMVTVTGSNDPQLRTGAENRLAVPVVTLRRMATDDRDLEVTGLLHGRNVRFGPGPGQVRLQPLSWWQHKLFLLRPVTTDDRPFCSQS
ncbi:hypothetical protein ASC64_19040 [Nocardioides sp. Root122]|uniref:HTTM domain-containing protein n=1 Tax=Nocardioides TaxID=1839 RepID=UPI000703A8B5|nr:MULTISPECIES: HTTM domain-containing protein [Nocardioides]KQV72747.1 hypothetical protein ASC64_19040 [Nocardioides sp. Root122]MCK9825296.1 HTTM domain-containing protein [Nocardioides cavernae]